MNQDEKLCPYCGETIKAIAVKCKYCKSSLANQSTLQRLPTETNKVLTKQPSIFTKTWKYLKFFILVLAALVFFLRHTDTGKAIVSNIKSGNSASNSNNREYSIGDIASSKFFSFRVNGIQFTNRVGNFLIGQDAGAGNRFLIIDVTIKNIDTESRVIDGGEVRASHNGKWLKFESPEVVLDENFIYFKELNPLTSVRGKVAFKVPAELQGPFYWIPPRTDGRIKLVDNSPGQSQDKNKNLNNSEKESIPVKPSSNIKKQDTIREPTELEKALFSPMKL